MQWMIFSILLMLLGLLLSWFYAPGKKMACLMGFGVFLSCFLYAAYYVADYFTGRGFDESVFFHLKVGLAGAGFGEYFSLIVVLFLLLICVFFVVLWWGGRMGRRGLVASVKPVAALFSIFFLFCSLMINPAIQDVYSHYKCTVSCGGVIDAGSLPEEFFYETPVINHKKNLVYIYLESLEATYLDETLFPGLLPNLQSLKSKAVNYTDIRQVTHTGWTIAGMVASQCGFPLFSSSHGNALSGMDFFLPRATCLPDILKSQGYHLEYYGGADLEFAGKGNYYRTHKFDVVKGRDELRSSLADEQVMSAWGLYDDALFSIIKNQYDRLSAARSPFALFGLTLDTHHPRGHISPACTGIEYAAGDNAMLNAVHCADFLVGDLIQYLLSSPYKNNTLVVISSDHLAMRNDVWKELNQRERKNLFMVFDPSRNKAGQEINHSGSLLDVAPTLLDYMDTGIEGLGFGRNLNAKASTLLVAKENIDDYLLDHQDVVHNFWSYPSIDKGISYRSSDKAYIQLGRRRLSIPVMLSINEANEVSGVTLLAQGQSNLSQYLEKKTQGDRLVWVDRCEVMSIYALLPEAIEESYCMAPFVVGSIDINVTPLKGEVFVSENSLVRGFEHAELNASSHRERLTALRVYKESDANRFAYLNFPVDVLKEKEVVVLSSAYNHGKSYVEIDGKTLPSDRGLSLIGFDSEGDFVQLDHIDYCALPEDSAEAELMSQRFSSSLHKSINSANASILLVHDSLTCTSHNPLSSVAENLGLSYLAKVAFRQPYVAVLSPERPAQEFYTSVMGRLRVRLLPSN